MISTKQIYKEDIELCYKLDSNTISLWSKNQWSNEFEKKGTQVFGILTENLIVGICVLQVVLDEAQINFFVVNQKYRKRGIGTLLMKYLIKRCRKQNINKLLLEVSSKNIIAKNFYNSFDFYTVGIRRNYYKDGSDALLKKKILRTNNL
tara:strand:+ start:483 stop:929 length:447 start_codon:yes stop_codon:yes gene_type:complete